MKLTSASLLVLFTASASALAQSTERTLSVPDAVPACMERSGPDCVLKSDMVTPRAAPPIAVIPPVTPTTPAEPPTAISPARTLPTTGVVGSTPATP